MASSLIFFVLVVVFTDRIFTVCVIPRVLMLAKLSFGMTTIRSLSEYSMGDESFDEMKLLPTRKKKLTFEFYFIFSSDMLRKEYIFFQNR